MSFIDELVSEIDSLLGDKDVHSIFQNQFSKFCQMVELHIAELQKYEEIVKENLDKLPEENEQAKDLLGKMQNAQLLIERVELWHQIIGLYNSLHKNPPDSNPKWTLGGFYNYIKREELISCLYVWHPPLKELPVNPVLWFYSEIGKHVFDSDIARQPSDDEKLMCDFIRLAVVHDESCAYKTRTMIYKQKEYEGRFLRDDFTKDLWDAYRNPRNDDFKRTHERILKQALKGIKANLAEQPAERGQKSEGSKIMITDRTSKDNWKAIKSEYGTSKSSLGKKINFVSDSFKREIIFRDVEQAFVLASEGFSKPALILAGGVIEELLRLYLKYKNIKPKNKRFADYIKACEDNDLLKRGVSRLSDSIRDFRNLVHLENEKTKSHTVSKAAAKGAVSSIFTIANDFQ